MATPVDVQLIEGLGLPYAPGAEAGLLDSALDPIFNNAWQAFLALFPGQTLLPLFDESAGRAARRSCRRRTAERRGAAESVPLVHAGRRRRGRRCDRDCAARVADGRVRRAAAADAPAHGGLLWHQSAGRLRANVSDPSGTLRRGRDLCVANRRRCRRRRPRRRHRAGMAARSRRTVDGEDHEAFGVRLPNSERHRSWYRRGRHRRRRR